MNNKNQHMPREFRTTESYQAEKITRAMLVRFLEERGFTAVHDQRRKYGQNESQTIHAVDPSGHDVSMRVKLCWRRGREGKAETYSATQLMANVKKGAWVESLNAYSNKCRKEEVTHMLIPQRDGNQIVHAALINVGALTEIWSAQRDESARLILERAMGRRKKNHAENGGSPTLWLQDDAAPSVPMKLWQHVGVTDLMKLPIKPLTDSRNDTLDDLIGFDPEVIGRDEADRIQMISSGVKRDFAVRRAVMKRCGFICENPGCGAKRDYPGFLDVHHILGVGESDRPWTCVALCPNCHREAHASPDRDKLNLLLLEFARQFSPTTTPK
jgi:5-methylcytosine-specific restriction protein A